MTRRAGRLGAGAAALSLLVGGAPQAVPGAEASGTRQAQAYQFYSLAQQSLLMRDYAGAVELLERAAVRDSSADLLMELAQLRFSLNDVGRAADLARQVAAANPGLGAPRKLLGDIDVSRAREGSEPEANLERAVDNYRAALVADPGDAAACQSLAEIYYETGRLEEAGGLLRTFSQAEPLDAGMSLLLGKVDLRTGRYEEAEQLLARIVERFPGNVEGADALAALYEYEKKFDKSIAVYTALLPNVPATAYLRDRLGSLQLRAGRFREAIAELEEGQRLDPGDGAGLLTLAQAFEAAGNTDAALSSYERLIEREPGNLEARFHRARLQEKEGDSEDALAGFRAIIDLSAGRGALSEREAAILALAHSQIGLIEMDSRNYDAAAQAFVKALDATAEPGPELFLLLGRAYLDGGKPEETRKVMVEAQKRFPDDLDLKVLRCEILIVRGEGAGARESYQSLLEDQKGSPEAYSKISEALLRQKRFGEAEAVLKEGTRRHPEDDGLLFARGAAMERLGRLGEAERLLAKAIRLNPKNAMALNYLGYMLADRGLKLKDSIEYVERALVLDPKNPAYLDSLGWAQFKLAQYEPAEKSLRGALRYDPSDPTIREHLGDLLMATGRRQEAVQEWERALARGHEEPERVKEKLQKARVAPKARE